MTLDANKVRLYTELGGYLALVVVSSVGAWFLPDEYHRMATLGLLAIGVLFDLLSLFYHIMTMATGKFMSGFPLVGLFFMPGFCSLPVFPWWAGGKWSWAAWCYSNW